MLNCNLMILNLCNSAVGGSTNECSDVYSGSQAFSEKESQSLRTFILSNKQNMIAYLTYHSYGQMWLYPWGYTSAFPQDWRELVSVTSYV